MKVKELIALLHAKDPNADVVVMGVGEKFYADIEPELREVPADRSVVIVPKT